MYSEIIILLPAPNCMGDRHHSALSGAQASNGKPNKCLLPCPSADAEAHKCGRSAPGLSINEESPPVITLPLFLSARTLAMPEPVSHHAHLQRWRHCLFELYALGIHDSHYFHLRPNLEHPSSLLCYTRHRYNPIGPPDTWLLPTWVAAEFRIAGRVANEYMLETTGAQTTISLWLERRGGPISQLQWERMRNAIENSVMMPGPIPTPVDMSTLYACIPNSSEIRLLVTGVRAHSDEEEASRTFSWF